MAASNETMGMVNGSKAIKRPLRLLMVEDEDSDAELLLRELRRGGFDLSYERVQSRPAMAEALTRGPWDIIVSDFSMPEFDAPRALAVLKESGLDLPFIVLSGTVTEESAVDALRAGAHDFISKGKLARLLPAIDRELREARVREANREAERRLRESEQRYRRIIETTNEGVWMIDESSKTTFVNARMASLLGFDPQDLLGKSILEFVCEESRVDAERILARREAGPAEQIEIRFCGSDGSDLWALVDSTSVLDAAGRYEGALVMAMDIGQRKGLEERLRQSQKLEAIGSLAGGIAHDFNNLLAIISSYTELLAQGITDDALREDLQEVQSAANRAVALTKQLMAFSRRQVLNPIVVDPNDLVLQMEKMLARVIGKGIVLGSRLGADIGRVKVDPGQFDQVVLNLVVNARDATPSGGRVTIETANAVLSERLDGLPVPPGRYVTLSVTDTGSGMDARTQSRLFEPFFTTKEPGKGTGLGLATVHGIVKQSGGHISVKSELGRGTTFVVYLPAAGDVA